MEINLLLDYLNYEHMVFSRVEKFQFLSEGEVLCERTGAFFTVPSNGRGRAFNETQFLKQFHGKNDGGGLGYV